MKKVCTGCGEKKELKPYIADIIGTDIELGEMLCEECRQKRAR